MRAALVGAVGLGLLAYAWLATEVFRAQADPESFGAGGGRLAWIIGPSARDLESAARRRMELGLAYLDDVALPAPERIERYHGELRRAETLLLRSLRALPTRAQALAALAAVRWEIEPPLDSDARSRHLETIALASRMAPTFPEVQRRLGELLLRMGRTGEALDYLRQTLELDPRLARVVVGLLIDYLVPADRMLAALPHHPLVLAELDRPFALESREEDYLALLEPALAPGLDPDHAIVLARYGSTCLKLERPQLLIERMDALGVQVEPKLEAERLVQRARGLAASGRFDEALSEVARARALEPDAPQRAQYAGDVLLAAGRPEAAIEAYRAALALLARLDAGTRARALVYRKIGQAEERRGRRDAAYDAYLRTLELAPEEPFALARVTAMERDAGFK